MMETQWPLPKIDLAACSACGDCAAACPEHALGFQFEKPFFQNPDDCTFCTLCEAVCPEGAVRCEFEIGWADFGSVHE